jgi:amidohydrolase
MSDRLARLTRLAHEIAPSAVALRRDIHRNPEVGWVERRTTRVVAAALEAAGIEPQIREDGVGLIADVGDGEPLVGFRADLDALPIAEENEVEYASQVPNVTHACGHDAHTAIGVGIATVLGQLETLPGAARFIFQPAEECIPGGATALREEGVHSKLRSLIAFHVDPALEPGRIGIREGGITGASDRITIKLRGPGGHTSRPHQTVDLAYVAARIITQLPILIRYGIDPRETTLIVFGRIQGGSAENVIPTHMELGGTVRLFDLEIWRKMPELIERILGDLVTPLGASFEVEYNRGSPPVVNDGVIIGVVQEAARACLGLDAVATTHQSLGSEDFAWYLEDVPGALIRLGAALPDRSADLHSARFDLHEGAIETGILVGAETLLRLMEQG